MQFDLKISDKDATLWSWFWDEELEEWFVKNVIERSIKSNNTQILVS